jgi:outer membrane protein TolC
MKKEIMYRLFVALVAVMAVVPSHAYSIQTQPDSLFMSVEDAIRVGLKRNFGIQIARNEAEIARLNRNFGAAGFTPGLDLTAGIGGGEEDITITENGTQTSSESITNQATNLDAALNWTIFDGLKMFTTYKKLQEFEKLGQTAARIQIENTVASIISAYYDIIRLEKRLTVLQNTVEISQERFRIADTKRMVGSGSEYEYLLAQADLNSDVAGVLREEVLLNDARVRLLILLNLDPALNVAVDSEISLDQPLNYSQVMEGIQTMNAQLSAATTQRTIATLERQEVLRGRLPTIDLTAGYLINNRETENSIRRLTEVDGFRYGATVRVPIFDGFNLNRKLQAAKLYEKNADLAYQDVASQLNGIAAAEYRNYESSREVVRIEQENLELVNQTVDIALERFYQGTITSLELRETQRTLINTETRLITAQYDAKISETELLRLMGRLVQE